MASSSCPVQVPCESGKSDSDKKRYRSSEENDDEIIVSLEQDENQERQVKKMPNSEDDDDDGQVHIIKEKLQEERKSLRIYECRDSLLECVGSNQVAIIVGEAGCGKTTQIPQYIYEAGYGEKGRIGCTQPYEFATRSAAARVSQEMGVKLGHHVVGYSIPFEDCTSENTVLRYMSDETLLHQLCGEPDLISYGVLMVDDAHERTLSTDILVGLLKDILRFRTNLKLLISTATIDCALKFSQFFDLAPILDIRKVKHAHNTEHVFCLNAAMIHTSGDTLVFLPDREEIEVTVDELQQRFPHQLSIRPFYENMSPELEALFSAPTPQGLRKVVLATSIAETFWPTKAGVDYVIDSGECLIKKYDPITDMESLEVTGISKASAMLRANPLFGKCIRMPPRQDHHNNDPHNIPLPVKRSNLANVVLTLRHLGVNDLTHFDFLDPPEAEALSKALEVLYALGALENKGQLTEVGELTVVGELMAQFPLDAMLSKAIVASYQYKCSAEIISIVAMLSACDHSSIFYRPDENQADADNARMRFHFGNVGDHIALLKVYNEWKDSNYSSQWCDENYIQARTMKRARDIRDQLERLLKKQVRIELFSNPLCIESIKKAITSGFFPHCAKLHHGSYRRVKQSPSTLHINQSSGMAEVFPRWVLYHELEMDLETTDQYMRHVTEINPEWLLEIAPHYYQYQLEDITD
ncbi:PREDICTED: putative pre-mRNA-splicing factor ATP-dependent RNA helicase DHX16-like [Fragaria vesca subsp. vesca]